MKIKIIQNILLVILVISSPISLSAQVHQWVISGGGKNSDNCRAFLVKSNGSTVIGGYYETPVTFDTATIDSPPFNGNYLASYSNEGKLEWLEVIDTRYGDIYNIKEDSKGNLYLLGSFSTDTARFGDLIVLPNKPVGSMFAYYLAKYNPEGKFEWIETFSEDDYTNDIKDLYIDKSGNSYIIGSFVDSIRFGEELLNSESDIKRNVFVTRINTDGNVEWTKKIGASTSEYLPYLSITGNETDIVAGGYLGGAGIIDSNTFSNEYFITKISDNGVIKNTVKNGGINIQNDIYGNIYYLRNDSLFKTNYNGMLVYGQPTIPVARKLIADDNGNVVVSREDLYDTNTERAITAKHNSQGELVWVTSGTGQIELAGLGVDSLGNLYFGGSFMSRTASFGSKELTNKGDQAYMRDMFLAKVVSPEIDGIEIKDNEGIPLAALKDEFLLNPGIVDIDKFHLSPSGNLDNTEILWYINDELVSNYNTPKECKNCRTQSENGFPWPAADGNYTLTAKPVWKNDTLKVEGSEYTLKFSIKKSPHDVIEKITLNTSEKISTILQEYNEFLLSDIDSSSVLNLYTNLFSRGKFEIKLDGNVIEVNQDDSNSQIPNYIVIPAMNLKQSGEHILTVSAGGKDGIAENQQFNIYVKETIDKVTSIQDADKEIFSVYPNPFQSQIQIRTNKVKGMVNISLTDLSGKDYFTGESSLSGEAILLDFEDINLKPGTYIIKVAQEGNEVVRERIVKL